MAVEWTLKSQINTFFVQNTAYVENTKDEWSILIWNWAETHKKSYGVKIFALSVQCCLEPITSVWNNHEINVKPVYILKRCISQIWPTIGWVYIQLHLKTPEKELRQKLVYLPKTSKCDINHINFKIFSNSLENCNFWQQNFDCNWHQKIGNKLGNKLSCGSICIIIWILVMLIQHIVQHVHFWDLWSWACLSMWMLHNTGNLLRCVLHIISKCHCNKANQLNDE